MATTRQSIIRGPGTVSFGGVKIHDSSGITANIESSTQDIESSVARKLNTIKTDQTGKISLTPVGNITQALLDLFFPAWMKKPVFGTSIMGETDRPLVVSSRAGMKVTFACAGLTKCPELLLSPVKTAFGGIEFTAVVANGKLPGESGAFYSVASAEYDGGEPSREGLSGCHYQATFGELAIPDTQDGWTVTPGLQLEPVGSDSQGTIDYTLSGVTVRASCTPLGLSEADILAALPAGKGRGASLASASDLVIAADGGLSVTLKNAALVTGPIQWGASQLRAGQLGFVANIAADGTLFDVTL